MLKYEVIDSQRVLYIIHNKSHSAFVNGASD